MKKFKLKSVAMLLSLVAVIAALQLVPALAQPGDQNDPLVTRSYVDSRIQELEAQIQALTTTGLPTQPAQPVQPTPDPLPPQDPVDHNPATPDPTPGAAPSVNYSQILVDFISYLEMMHGDIMTALLHAAGVDFDQINTGGNMPGNIADNITVPGEVVPFTPLAIPMGYQLVAHMGAEFILRSGSAVAVSGPDGMVNVTAGRDVVHGEPIPTNNLLLVPRSDGRGFVAHTDTWVMIKGGFDIVPQN